VSVVRSLLKAFNQKPIVIYPVYIKLTGDYASAAALAQVIYWHEVKGSEFYKDDDEFSKELELTLRQFRRVKAILKTLDFLKIKPKGTPAKTFYDVNYDELGLAINKIIESSSLYQNVQTGMHQNVQTGMHQNVQTGMHQNVQTGMHQNVQTIYTENTTENTTENFNNTYKANDKNNSVDNCFFELGTTNQDLIDAFKNICALKNRPISKFHLSNIKAEGEKSGFSFEEILKICVKKNWANYEHGFELNGYRTKNKNNSGNKQQPLKTEPAHIPSSDWLED
jgi:hypothetical protein